MSFASSPVLQRICQPDTSRSGLLATEFTPMITSQHAGSMPHGSDGRTDSRMSTDDPRGNRLPDHRRDQIDPRANDIALINYLRQMKFEQETSGIV
jgi:hypothetical protein